MHLVFKVPIHPYVTSINNGWRATKDVTTGLLSTSYSFASRTYQTVDCVEQATNLITI